jgi:Protein of unknown function (DUF3570)
MKKIILTAGLLASMLTGAHSQTKATETQADYEKRKLKIEEINLVSSYYQQDGNNSAVTGGVGTEQLFDIANSLDLRLSFMDRKNRQHSINADFNIDYYSSASSDNIDPRSISGASREDLHIYPSVAWSMKSDRTRTTKGLSYAYSTEWDYWSHGFNFNFSKASKDNNREISIKGGAFFDKWEVILPTEFRTATTGGTGTRNYKPRNSYNLALSYSQVINKNLQMLFTFEPAFQEGLLSTPYHRIYYNNNTAAIERLPGTRLKFPVSLRANYFLGDNVIVRAFYRFYADDWGMTAHTTNIEIPYKITPFLSVSPYYRFSHQKAVRYFQAYGAHNPALLYHTSDYDIGTFNSHFVGAGLRYAPPGGMMGVKFLNSAELRYGFYQRSTGTGMTSHIVSLLFKVKP